MAKKSGKVGGEGTYGSGGNRANPFFPSETSYQGPGKSIQSPHGSIFESLPVQKRNAFQERLDGRAFGGGKKGR